MIPNQQLADLIGTIYDCAVDSALWPLALERIRSLLSFHNATLSGFDLPSGTQFLGVNVGIPPEWEERMAGYAADIVNMWGGLERLAQFPLEEPIILSQVAGEALNQNRYFREWKLPQGSTDTVMIGLARDSCMMAGIGLGRHSTQKAIDENNLAVLRLLAPHLRRAVAIGRIIDIHRLEAKTFAATLEALPSAILFVDPAGRILHANRAADQLLQSESFCIVANGIPTLRDARANVRLHRGITMAASQEAVLGSTGSGVATRSLTGEPMVIHILPLNPNGMRGRLAKGATAALFITPAHGGGSFPGEALAILYDLTPAETGIMQLLAQGRTTKEISEVLGVAPSTIKTHLLRLFAKTNCKRQIDLVDLTRSFRGPV